jgi:hypothetical protein
MVDPEMVGEMSVIGDIEEEEVRLFARFQGAQGVLLAYGPGSPPPS